MKHLEKAQNMAITAEAIEDKFGLNENAANALKIADTHTLIAIAEQLVIANEFKRIELENVEGLKVKMKDLPLWFRNKE